MSKWLIALPFAAALLIVARGAAGEEGKAPAEPVVKQHGKASFYSNKFQGKKTATGERFHQRDKTAASKTLPLGTRVKVTNQDTGKSTTVRINDRGPYVGGRVIDLSEQAAKEIGLKEEGVAPVVVEARPSAQPTPELKEKVKQTAARQERRRPETREAQASPRVQQAELPD